MQRREINFKYNELQYSYSKQIELHGDYNLVNKENSALSGIVTSLEKQLAMMSREVVEVKAKCETAHQENKKLREGGEDLMILISEANKQKREQHSII